MIDETAERGDADEEFAENASLAASTPSTYKILGELSATDGVGVLGRNTATSGAAHGVWGETSSESDRASGVEGHATASGTATEARGVVGVTDADGDASTSPILRTAGVHGTATGENVVQGVLGEAVEKDGHGVVGRNATRDFFINTNIPSGVTGITDRSGDDAGVDVARGVVGWALASFGEAYGVEGVSTTPDGAAVHGDDKTGGGYGVLSTGDSRTEGDQEVTGSQSVGKTTLSVYPSGNQTIPSGARTTVEFDAVDADHFGGWNDANHEYTIQEDGDYHLDFGCRWLLLPDGTREELWVVINLHDRLRNTAAAPNTLQGSRTFPGLSSGDTIRVDVSQDAGSSYDLNGGEPDTFLSITKVG